MNRLKVTMKNGDIRYGWIDYNAGIGEIYALLDDEFKGWEDYKII